MKLTYYFFQFVVILFLLSSCTKKDDLNDSGNGQIQLNVQSTLSDFSSALTSGKMASNYSYAPQQVETVNFNKDYMFQAQLLPMDDMGNTNGSKYLTSNRKLAGNMNTGIVYTLLVYDNNGKFIAKRDYTRGSEANTEALHLFRNTAYTFIAYSLNKSDIAELNNLLYLENKANPPISNLENSSTLTNTFIWEKNTSDLLFYKKTIKTQNQATDNLNIILKHQYNLIQMTLDVSDSGYSIDGLDANLESNFSSVQINFATGEHKRLSKFDYVFFSDYEYSTVNGVTKAKAITEPVVFSAKSGEKLLEINELTIGGITSDDYIYPFASKGVELIIGQKYNLNVKMIPRDKTLKYENQPAVLLGGQVWMRYSLGSPGDLNNANGSDADMVGDNTHGAYYQWGKQKAGINANSTSTNTYWDNYGIPGTAGTLYFRRWNEGNQTAPIKGLEDPCPDGYRLPVKKDFETLLGYIEKDYRKFIGISGTKNYGLQLTSKYNSNAKLTFPASGYGYMGNDGGQYNVGFGGLLGRYKEIHLKTSYYGDGIPNLVNSVGAPGGTAYQTKYMLYSPNSNETGTNRILTYPGSPRVSASVNAHPVRCIAIKSAAAIIQMNEREIESGGNNNIDY